MHGKIQNINNPIRFDQFVKIDPYSMKYEYQDRKYLIEIFNHFDEYELIETNVTNTNGVYLYAFCKKRHSNFVKNDDINRRIDHCVSNIKNKVFIAPTLWLHCIDEAKFEALKDVDVVNIRKETNFWWDESLNQMFFFGAQDRVRAFNSAMIHEYELYINKIKKDL